MSEAAEKARPESCLRIPAAPGSFGLITAYVQTLARRGQLGPSAAYRLRLAVDELATNVVVHGYAGAEGELFVHGGVDDGLVWVRVEDTAPPFDPREGRRPPARGVPLQERPIGGLGVHLALTSVDHFAYTYAGGRNISTLAVRAAPA